MNKQNRARTLSSRLSPVSCPGLLLLGAIGAGTALPASAEIAQSPLFLSPAVTPQVMLNLSNDHQLYFKAYDDYSDLTGDGITNTSYNHAIDYYGYFDHGKCYTYTNNTFVPVSVTADKYCNGSQWSGNFMNWVSMARIDTVRKLLYGGFRREDTAARTILERTYLPNDAHSWAKYYNGTDLNQLTPFNVTTGQQTQDSGITFCNTTRPGNMNVLSQNVNTASNPPQIRVARGNFMLWATNERWQCQWHNERNQTIGGDSGSNGNIPALTGLLAANDNPRQPQDGLGNSGANRGQFHARIQACVEGLVGSERCKRYPDGNLKPIGLLQAYGDDNLIDFGLISGSYNRNKSGGVLRKNIGSFSDEVNVDSDGTFRPQPDSGSIVGTLDRFRIYGYRHDDGTYHGMAGSAWCGFQQASFPEGDCNDWGNPQAEIFLESLRYFAGKEASTAFNTNDGNRIADLITATWQDPLSEANYCAPLNVIQFNASTSSYDGDQLDGAADINIAGGAAGVRALTNTVGAGENIHGQQWFVGSTPGNNNQLCTPKTINALGDVTGTCPDAPRLGGTYNIAGLAFHAWTQGIRDDLPGDQKVKTYGVALSPAVPQVKIPIPNSSNSVTLLPACRNTLTNPDSNCAIVDFKIVEQDLANGTGKLYVNWEDSEQGGDFDFDIWGMIDYSISGNELTIETNVIAQSTSGVMGFGYILSGTSNDGFHVHSGTNGFNFVDPSGGLGCANCQVGNGPTSRTYTVGGAQAGTLEQPLFYAAKWGGFDTSGGATTPSSSDLWDKSGNGMPDNYFLAVDPAELEASLEKVFMDVLERRVATTSAATNSTTLQQDSMIFTSQFITNDWSGRLQGRSLNPGAFYGPAFPDDMDWSKLPENFVFNPLQYHQTILWEASNTVRGRPPEQRNIVTWNPDAGVSGSGVHFDFPELSALQQSSLAGAGGSAEQRLAYLRGDQSNEQQNGGNFRNRESLLGDIINSSPVFVGDQDYGYAQSGADDGTYQAFLLTKEDRAPMIYVGANAGMLHGFDALTGAERFAFVPNGVFPKLASLTDPNYIHQYYVDATPAVADAMIGNEWRTVAVGALGAGGKSIYALDVTHPNNLGPQSVLWEFSHPELGYVLGQPNVVRLNDGSWAVVVGNGYLSESGKAQLFIIDLEDGTLIRIIDTWAGFENGLSATTPYDAGFNNVVDRIYAGDLQGNLWAFDLSSSLAANWGPRYAGVDPIPLFRARDSNAIPQPITAAPRVARTANGFAMIFFGTGQYFQTNHHTINDGDPVNSFYAIKDLGEAMDPGTGRDQLTRNIISYQTSAFGRQLRVVRQEGNTQPGGWYLDLIVGDNVTGERVTFQPSLRDGTVLFTTLIPFVDDPCQLGAGGFLMELDALTGNPLKQANWDLDLSGEPTLIDDGSGNMTRPSGMDFGTNAPPAPGITVNVSPNRRVTLISEDLISSFINVPRGRAWWRQAR